VDDVRQAILDDLDDLIKQCERKRATLWEILSELDWKFMYDKRDLFLRAKQASVRPVDLAKAAKARGYDWTPRWVANEIRDAVQHAEREARRAAARDTGNAD
jgi:hypothetical protein